MLTAALFLALGLGVAPLVENVPVVKQIQAVVRFARTIVAGWLRGE